jgi:hypothetical protein
MGKIWLKSVDPSKQCCPCDGKAGPCDTCCLNKVIEKTNFSIKDQKFLSRIDDNIQYSDLSLNWETSSIIDSTFQDSNVNKRGLLILAKKNQKFNFSFNYDQGYFSRLTYSFPSQNQVNSSFGNFRIIKSTTFSKKSTYFSANNKDTYGSFSVSSTNNGYNLTSFQSLFSSNTSPFAADTNQGKKSILLDLSKTETNQVNQSIYSIAASQNQKWFGANGFFFGAPEFSSTPFTRTDVLSEPILNATPPAGQIKEILVATTTYRNTSTFPFVASDTNELVPVSNWETSERLPVGIRYFKDTFPSPLGGDIRYNKEQYLQYIEKLQTPLFPDSPFDLEMIAIKDSCLQIYFSNSFLDSFSLTSDKKINFQKLSFA